MAELQVTATASEDNTAEARAELLKAVQFAAEDAGQLAELTEALLEVYPHTGENTRLVAQTVAARLTDSAMKIMRAVRAIPAQEVASHG